MALINCPHCGRSVSSRATTCPHCGRKLYPATKDAIQELSTVGEHSSNKTLKTITVVLAIAAIALCGWLYYNFQQEKRAEEERIRAEQLERQKALEKQEQALLAAQARQDSIDAAKAAEQARQDSIRRAHRETINLYLNKVREFSYTEDGNGGDYFLYDITGDGTPELWMEGGYGYSSMYVYTYSKNGLKLIYEGAGGHASYHLGKGYIIEDIAHMGYERWNKLTYCNGKVKSKIIHEEEDIQDSNYYNEPSEPLAPSYNLSYEDPILSMF